MRPLYETDDDKAAELAAMQIIVGVKRTIEKLPMAYHLDFGLFDNFDNLTSLWEVKCRSVPHMCYPTYMISALKYHNAISMARTLCKPVYLLVRWTDALGVADLQVAQVVHIKHGGRNDRGDPQDQEPVIHIPISDFHIYDGEGTLIKNPNHA